MVSSSRLQCAHFSELVGFCIVVSHCIPHHPSSCFRTLHRAPLSIVIPNQLSTRTMTFRG
eukprot:791500-Pelagomonas_calceolata.AAC.1